MKKRSGPFVLAFLLSISAAAAAGQKCSGLWHVWEWELTTGGLSGRDSLTPEKAGYNRKIEFTKKGKYREFRSDSLIVETRYTIRADKTIFSGDSMRVVRFADSARLEPQVIWKVSGDTLELGDCHVEPFGHLYLRTVK